MIPKSKIMDSFYSRFILLFRFAVVAISLLFSNHSLSQGACGFGPGKGCSNTEYDNAFMNSNNDASTIEYDNFVSSYHSSSVRTFDGTFRVWGEGMANNGTGNLFSPTVLNSTNFPALGSAEVYKVAGGSFSAFNLQQFVVLASDGLYIWGTRGFVLNNTIGTSSVFQKIAIGGNANGLPAGVTPADVKMVVASSAATGLGTLMIVTCDGRVFSISGIAELRGNGSTGNATTWSQVTDNTSANLTNVVAARVAGRVAMALKSDGTIWTWGQNSFLGNSSAAANRNRATQMTKPVGIPKMIGVTTNRESATVSHASYYVLMTNGRLYSMGRNAERQLGDFTTNLSSINN